MTGHFHKKYFWNTLCLLCGLFLIGLFVFLHYKDPGSDSFAGVTLGVIISVCSLVSLFLNMGAFLEVRDGVVRAKYHWFGKLQCSVKDIAFVMAQINTLNILLKNGKRYNIMGIENAYAISTGLRRQIFTLQEETPGPLYQQLEKMKKQRKKELIWTISGCVLMFANIFIAAFLTDFKEMSDFSKLDWTFFTLMGLAELLTVVGTFYVASLAGSYVLPIQQLQYCIKGAEIATLPLPSGNVRAVYTDENYTGRVIVYGFPNDEGVYYTVQEFVASSELKTVHVSDIYKSEADMDTEALGELIDISSRFL